GGDDLAGELILGAEQIGLVEFPPTGPQHPPGLAFRELQVEPQAVTALPETPGQHIAHAETPADFGQVRIVAAIGEAGIAGDDEESTEAREIDDDALGQTLGEILLLGIAGPVLERQ